MAERACDVIIWGATGFTGRLVVSYFARTVAARHPQLRWAVGGRNAERLRRVRAEAVEVC